MKIFDIGKMKVFKWPCKFLHLLAPLIVHVENDCISIHSHEHISRLEPFFTVQKRKGFTTQQALRMSEVISPY